MSDWRPPEGWPTNYVDHADFCKLERAAREVVDAVEAFFDPKVRVGPVWPTTQRLKALLDGDPCVRATGELTTKEESHGNDQP